MTTLDQARAVSQRLRDYWDGGTAIEAANTIDALVATVETLQDSCEAKADRIDRLGETVERLTKVDAEPVATLWQHSETGRTRIVMPDQITDCDARWFRVDDLVPVSALAALQQQLIEAHTEIGAQARKIDELRAENERMREALEKIDQWAKAYPLSVFPEPDFKKAHEVLTANGMTLDAISASNMRHVVTGVGEIARAALENKHD